MSVGRIRRAPSTLIDPPYFLADQGGAACHPYFLRRQPYWVEESLKLIAVRKVTKVNFFPVIQRANTCFKGRAVAQKQRKNFSSYASNIRKSARDKSIRTKILIVGPAKRYRCDCPRPAH